MSKSGRPIIGLAGGIGAGKSSVAKMLAELGCVVSDSDAAAREALRDPQIKKKVVEWWGPAVLDNRGEIDRAAIAAIIFPDPQQRKRLEDLTHPWIERKRVKDFAAGPADAPALVIDAPLLFEAGLDAQCDAVIFVDAADAVRLARIQATRGWTPRELALRQQSQMPLDRKRRQADHVVENNGDLNQLQAQVRRILDMIIQDCRS